MNSVASEAFPALQDLPEVLRPAVAFYLDVHSHPELSGAEARTADRFAARLAEAGCEVTTGVGGHGVVGLLRNGPGPVVLLRAELDALPVEETTGLSYASKATAPGPDGRPVPVTHACGHDLHLACAAGATALLSGAAAHWSGTLMVVGQPAEETLGGARAMLEDGLYRRFAAPDVVLAQHTTPLPAGMVAHATGPVLAGSRMLRVVVHGRGGHAGSPHLAVDPVVTAAALVLRLQSVVSRETSPAEQVVVTVGSLHAGSAGNVVADRATLEVSVRAFTEAALDRVTAAVRRIAAAECAASACPREPSIEVLSDSRPTVGDPTLTAAIRRAHERAFGPERVADWHPSTATEDFPLLGEAGLTLHGVPGIHSAYWMLGCVGPRQWAAATGRPTAAGQPAAERVATNGASRPPGQPTAAGQPDGDGTSGTQRSPAEPTAPVPTDDDGTSGMSVHRETDGRAAAGGRLPLPANHSPDFRPDPRLTIPAGISALTVAALTRLAGPQG